jgi:uncharacterized membrane protein YfcA
MHIYLPIAQLSGNIFTLMLLGGVTGLFAGLFGVGGGFILTPMLMFMGVPSAVAVATSTNMMVASSFSGFLSHLKHKRVDIAMGCYLIGGGVIGALLGIWIFASLQRVGQFDLMIKVLYVSLLSAVGLMMLREMRQILIARHRTGIASDTGTPIILPTWVASLPWQRDFARSAVRHSILLPVGLGVISGIIVGLLGIGGGFITIPMMIYILRMPLSVTVGTSLFQIIFITGVTTFLHAITTHEVDIVLAALLLVGSSIGAQYGVRFSHRIPTYMLRGMMAALLLIVAGRLAYGLFVTPSDMFALVVSP